MPLTASVGIASVPFAMALAILSKDHAVTIVVSGDTLPQFPVSPQRPGRLPVPPPSQPVSTEAVTAPVSVEAVAAPVSAEAVAAYAFVEAAPSTEVIP